MAPAPVPPRERTLSQHARDGAAAAGRDGSGGRLSPAARGAVARLVILAAGVGLLFALVAAGGGLSAGRVRDWADGAGWLAPVAFVALSSALTVACVPGPLLAAASGLLFGTAVGTPVAIASATLGAALAFLVARLVGAGALDELSGRRVSALQGWIARRGFLAVLYARIIPAMPYNLVNYAAGLTRVGLGAFALATAVGCAPRAFAYVALGGSLDDLGRPEALVAFAVLVGMALVGIAFAVRDARAVLASRRAS